MAMETPEKGNNGSRSEGESPGSPVWVEKKSINEVAFARDLLDRHPMKYVGGLLLDVNGRVDERALRKEVFDMLSPYKNSNISNTLDRLLNTIKVSCFEEKIPMMADELHVANGTYRLDGNFTEKMDICLNRFPVRYDPGAKKPELWLRFLNTLLDPEDIPALQQFMGYSFIPMTKAQAMLLMYGEGGEGKSRIGLVMRMLLGDAMSMTSIQKIENNRFARADLVGKLLLVDDDMDMSALTKTNYIKTLVTLEDKFDIERKGQQSEQQRLYCRFMLFGNGSLKALHDRSYGFYRRQVIIKVRPRDKDRQDDPFLIEKLALEKEGIFLWALQGLQDLVRQQFHFTISEKSQQLLKEQLRDANNVIAFMSSEGYLLFDKNAVITSSQLYDVYKIWCQENVENAMVPKSFLTEVKKLQDDYGIREDTNIRLPGGKRCRGFKGIQSRIRTDYGI
jgi:putative DNA primase/helicase